MLQSESRSSFCFSSALLLQVRSDLFVVFLDALPQCQRSIAFLQPVLDTFDPFIELLYFFWCHGLPLWPREKKQKEMEG
jgi:hypothetical protein